MTQTPPLDPARDWLLEQIQDDPVMIDTMSENELDQALALLGMQGISWERMRSPFDEGGVDG